MSLAESFVGFEMDSKSMRDSSWRSIVNGFVDYIADKRER